MNGNGSHLSSDDLTPPSSAAPLSPLQPVNSNFLDKSVDLLPPSVASMSFSADCLDDPTELDDRISFLEKKVSLQDDEIQCLKSALADALRRLSVVETQSHRILPNTPTPGKSKSSGLHPMRTSFSAVTPTPPIINKRASTPGAESRSASKNGRWTPDSRTPETYTANVKSSHRPPSPANSVRSSLKKISGALDIDLSPHRPSISPGSHKSTEAMAQAGRQRRSSGGSSGNSVDPSEGVIRLTLRGRNVPLYIPSELIPDYEISNPNPPPKEQLKLDWVYGYRGRDCRSNLYLLPTGELIYPIAGIVVLYNVEEQMQRHYLGHTDDVKSLAVHPDKITIASGQVAGHDKKTARAHIRVWDSVSLNTLKVIGGGGDFGNAVCCLSFSHTDGGRHLAAVDDSNDHVLSVWEWEKGENGHKITETKSSADPVLAVEFHPTEKWSLISCGKSHLSFWNFEGGCLNKKQGVFEKYDKPKYVLCLSFTPEGDVVTGDSNGNIFYWSSANQRISGAILNAHEGGVFSMVHKTDGSLISGGGKDRRLVAWAPDAASSSSSKLAETEVDEALGPVRCLAMGKGHTVVVGTTKNAILQGSLDVGFSPIVRGHVDDLWGLAVHPTQHQFVSAAHDKMVHMWDTMSHSVIWSVEVPDKAQSAAFHPSGAWIAVGLTSGKWLILDASTHEITSRQMDGNEQLDAIAFSPDGTIIAVGSHDNFIYMHQFGEDGSVSRMGRCSGHSSFVTHLDWSADSNHVRSNSGDYEILYWNPRTCKQISQASSLRDVEWASDTCTLSFNACGIWQEGADGTDVNGCSRSRGNKLLASGDDSGKVSLYSYPCNQLQSKAHVYGGHSSHVTSLRFLFDDSRLLTTGGKDTAILQWTIE